jgi:hypothetical protein
MKKSVALLFIAILTSNLSGCIISKSPQEAKGVRPGFL